LILDTNALSAIADGEPGAAAQVAKASKLTIPVIVLGEYRFGIAQSRRKAEYE
jgi:tRNA(fMet)-specific endonuclease VapC